MGSPVSLARKERIRKKGHLLRGIQLQKNSNYWAWLELWVRAEAMCFALPVWALLNEEGWAGKEGGGAENKRNVEANPKHCEKVICFDMSN